jgi:hypothetical protein
MTSFSTSSEVRLAPNWETPAWQVSQSIWLKDEILFEQVCALALKREFSGFFLGFQVQLVLIIHLTKYFLESFLTVPQNVFL